MPLTGTPHSSDHSAFNEMPALATKGKGKGRDARRSRSRNTTPNSVISTSALPSAPALTAYLGIDTARLLVPSGPQYAEIVEKLELKQGMPEPKHLDMLVEQLRQLSDAAEARSQACHLAMTALSDKRKEIAEQERERERQEREAEARRARIRKEAEEADEDAVIRKAGKMKKRKDRPSVREERPVVHGAHELAQQDGVVVKQEEESEKPRAVRAILSPGPADHPSPSKRAKLSPGSSSLSEMAQSPDATTGAVDKSSPKRAVPSAETSDDERQPPPAPPVTQHAFFPDPLAPDPVIYHIREVTPGMPDEEKKEIYSVTGFPTQDLSDQIAGTPPDKDFSNAKPTNQVAANTFLSYVEPYVRPLTEEDIAFLRERGDRTTPFVIPSRGERHYSEIWAAEDTNTALVASNERSSANKANGTIEDINDDTIGTDKISGGPLANRLLSLLRFEHRTSPTENGNTMTNGAGPGDTNLFGNDTSMDLDNLTNGNLDPTEPKPLPPASSVADQHAPKPPPNNSSTNGTSATTNNGTGHPPPDDRIKAELRHLGFLGIDEEPDFDGHHDDDISVRLRLLQSELKRVMITNGARKARLLDIARERLAYQEYSTIHEDLDSQVQQAYLKRTRTLGKSKKGHGHQGGGGAGRPRPNAANGVSAGAGGANGVAGAAGLARQRDIGDSARMLMDRRKRWEDCIGPVFEGMRQGVPKGLEAGGETLWDERVMERYEKAEREGLEDETDG